MIALLFLLAAAQDEPMSMAELRALHENADCERIIVATSAIGAFGLGAAVAERSAVEQREISFIRGDCLVTIGNIREATELFRAIFLEQVDAQPGFELDPRVAILVEAARADVVKRREREAAEARRHITDGITIDVTPPVEVKGGGRAIFAVALVDPTGAVASMRVDFRKRGAPEFYALPVEKGADGAWRGAVPGTYTKSANGAVLEWYVTASDTRGERLKSFGSRDEPRSLVILPGSVIAEDLKASERVPQLTRVISGLVVTPMFTFAGVVVGLVVASIVNFAAVSLIGPGFAGRIVAGTFFAVAPFVGGVAGTAVVATAVLDREDALLATAAVGALLGVGAIFGVTHMVEHGINVLTASGEPSLTLGYAALSGAVAVAASGIVPPVLVLLDPPEE